MLHFFTDRSLFYILSCPLFQNLALCTASLMYILSRDRLNMDLDRASLELMIRLLELEQDKTADSQLSAKEMSKVKERIRKLCETVHNKHLDLENITVPRLLRFTSHFFTCPCRRYTHQQIFLLKSRVCSENRNVVL